MNKIELCKSKIVVIGAGIVGMAIARAFAMAGQEVIVLEKENVPGQHQSSRNSEVIHAGIYYAPHSIKARLCVEGRQMLYRYAQERGIAHRNLGKLVVATHESQLTKLESIARQSHECGVKVEMLDRAQANAMEPELSCQAALWSPLTGIIDTHAYLLALQGDAEAHGAKVICRATVTSGERLGGQWRLWVDSPERFALDCDLVINCAGLFAPALAAKFLDYPSQRIPDAWFAKGNYFNCRARSPFSRLIYPLPDAVGLGIHLILDMAGQVRFGPDVELVETVEYSVKAERTEHFYESIRAYWPGLPALSLTPAYAGVRAKIGQHGAVQDFTIETEADHGLPGLINLFGIESPGMTSSLAIAQEVLGKSYIAPHSSFALAAS